MRKLNWQGYEWHVKSAPDQKVGPGPNYFSEREEDIFTDDQGLHLATSFFNNRWHSTEAVLGTPLGHGTYTFTINTPIAPLERNVVLSGFLYQDDDHELDIEFSPAMIGESKVQYAVQPAHGDKNRYKSFDTPSAAPEHSQASTHRIVWLPDRVEFQSWHGIQPDPLGSTLISEWHFEDAASLPYQEHALFIFNLWLYKGKDPERAQTVIVRSFTFDRLPS